MLNGFLKISDKHSYLYFKHLVQTACLAWLLVLMVGIAHSSVVHVGSGTTLLEELAASSPISKRHPVVMYDNINYSVNSDGDEQPVFSRGSKNLIAADVIDVNFNMSYLFHAPVKIPGDMLGRLIYANIELEKMLEQYRSMRKKAEEIAVTASSLSISSDPISVYMPTTAIILAEDTHDQNADKVSGKTGEEKPGSSVGTRMKVLESRIRTLFSSARTAEPIKPEDVGQGDNDKIVGAQQGLHANSRFEPSLAPEKFLNLASRSYRMNRSFSVHGGSYSSEENLEGKGESRRKVEPMAPEELPWWIRMPSEFISYCMANKLEASLWLLVFIFLLNVIGGIFRSR